MLGFLRATESAVGVYTVLIHEEKYALVKTVDGGAGGVLLVVN